MKVSILYLLFINASRHSSFGVIVLRQMHSHGLLQGIPFN